MVKCAHLTSQLCVMLETKQQTRHKQGPRYKHMLAMRDAVPPGRL